MSVSVKYLNGKRFEVTCRGHSIIVDQPESEDGTDEGMTPVELLNASFSACAAYYALLFLKRRVKNLNSLEVRASWKYSEKPRRIGAINLIVIPPRALTEQEKAGLLKSIEQCTVENTLRNSPEINIDVKD